jgi:hypothetical protein
VEILPEAPHTKDISLNGLLMRNVSNEENVDAKCLVRISALNSKGLVVLGVDHKEWLESKK